MKKIAITGGIGSGKSYVCRELSRRGIGVYDCDAAAKRLMVSDAHLQESLRALVGAEVYADGKLQKAVLAKYLLQSEAHKQALNDVVHPAVAADFEQSGYGWIESAILFDSGFCKRIHLDAVVCVTAPREVRIARVMARDGIDRQKAMEWMNAQMPQEEVLALSNYQIVNDGESDIVAQVTQLLEQLESKQ